MGGITRPAELTDETRPARRDRLGEYGGVEVRRERGGSGDPGVAGKFLPNFSKNADRGLRYRRYDRYIRYIRYIRYDRYDRYTTQARCRQRRCPKVGCPQPGCPQNTWRSPGGMIRLRLLCESVFVVCVLGLLGPSVRFSNVAFLLSFCCARVHSVWRALRSW